MAATSTSQLTFFLEPARERQGLAADWQNLERHAEISFFQSWAWIGTWLASLPDGCDPICLTAREGGTLVGLGLFTPRKRRRRVFIRANQVYLQTTGDPDHDRLTIEYNGLLVHKRAPKEIGAACLGHLFAQKALCDELHLEGVTPLWQDIAAGLDAHILLRQTSVCPFRTLRAATGGAILDDLGSNTRQQIRRSRKLYGDIATEVATDLAAARRIWDEMRDLHQDYWHGKGEEGAFDAAVFESFHQRLITGHLSSGRVQLIRVRGSEGTIGCLYNFVHRGRVYAYQSGLRYSSDKRLKPGLVSHLEAIELNRRLGHDCYDFLAGDARYKRSLANGSNELLWIVVQRPKAAFWLENHLRDLKNFALSFRSDPET